mmetsp:Transcript_30180/g.39762  ORF Transcript_30180/g.39762 Transcript_30180/m.39762 type:complete len:259 (-) Transcript_30180:54-830(-)|eukprot:CAMPEP_0117733984 /NCGR_PEP_ID=MMETSP0947-20121206/393_1 /TAXON_ID=44440 /ORGANISM="Chattonella subsalsa, Strain CCMP2191" /LENGTH=258 /DNA_ID=CAMNT_0005548655 /DNA_START=62 /DNA_END=838 /DNA_ORIENTATION=+
MRSYLTYMNSHGFNLLSPSKHFRTLFDTRNFPSIGQSALAVSKLRHFSAFPQLTVVVDLDECMVHSRFLEFHENNPMHVDYRQAEWRPEHVKEVNSFECTLPWEETVIVNKRPHLDHFLQEVSDEYRCISFTASDEHYASVVLDHLDPGHHFFTDRLFKESCRKVKGIALKDLSVISDDLSRIVLIENSSKAILANPLNAILVPPFYDNTEDTALKEVLELLHELDGVPDVRPVLQERLKYDFIYKAEIRSLFDVHVA